MSRQGFAGLTPYTRFLFVYRRWIVAIATVVALVSGYRTVLTLSLIHI